MDHSDIDISDLLADDEDDQFNLSDVIPSITSITASPAPNPVIIEDRSFVSDPRPVELFECKMPTRTRKRPSTAKPKRSSRTKTSSKKNKVRSRPQSAFVPSVRHSKSQSKPKHKSKSKSLQTAIRRFEALQKTQAIADKKRRDKNAKYNPKQWFDSNLVRGVDDWREENYKLRSEVSVFKKENAKLKCQIKSLEKNDAKRAKEIQALITVALQNNLHQHSSEHGTTSGSTKSKQRTKSKYGKYGGSNLKQTELLMQLRHEQSIHGSLRKKIKTLRQEIKQNRKQMLVQQQDHYNGRSNNMSSKIREYEAYKWEDLQIEIRSLRQRLKQKDEVIENTKINEREQLEMQFKVLVDAKDNELREMDRTNQRLEEQCKVLMEELDETNKHQVIQEKKTQKMVTFDQFIERLHRQQNESQNETENEYKVSHRIVDKLYSDWMDFKSDHTVDIDGKATEWKTFFGEMDGIFSDLTDQLHLIRQRLKAKEVLNCEEHR